MKINSLKVAGLYSFGPEQELNDFKTFNLFIGANGSGKTNVFKILEGVELDYDIVKDTSGNPVFTPFQFSFGAVSTLTQTNIFTPTISSEKFNIVNNRFLHNANIKKSLEISYLDYNGESALIKLEDCDGGHLRYIHDDVGLQKRCIKKIKKPQSEFEFYKDLVKFYGSNVSWLPLFNFGLFYIFDLKIRFLNNGSFVQGSNYGSVNVEENTTELPSGILHCAQLLTRYFKSDGTVILIDEPELYFEPRALRRFFEFLVWLNIGESTGSAYASQISKKIQSLLDSNKLESGFSIFAENINADGSPKYFEVNKFNTPDKQIFIASHSSVLINELMKLQEFGAIYRFKLEKNEFLRDGLEKIPEKNFVAKCCESFSAVYKINNETHGLLDDLGCKGSDLLQANGIIWVEGPSDVIYIRKWLEMYANEYKKKAFKQGVDYEFQMFGGTLLDSLCLIKDDDSTEEEEFKKLVSMLSFSRNAFVVIDSDAVKKAGKIIDKSKFQNAKQYIKNQFEEMNNPNLGLWYKKDHTKIRTIEDYIPKKFKPSRVGTKKLKAQDNIQVWDDQVKLSDFNHSLNNEIKTLYELIEKWAQ